MIGLGDPQSMAVGVVGLGVMGRPIATNLLEAGYDVLVWSRSQGPIQELRRRGALPAEGVVDLGRRSTIVITLLPDPATVKKVALGGSGLIASLQSGSLFIDMGTGDPKTATDLYAVGRERNVEVLDAPISGGEEGAKGATLSMMVGGTSEAFSRARPLLETLGTVEHVGGPGAGQIVKAANQMIVGGVIALVSEALLLVERAGIDPLAAMRAMSRGLASTRVMDLRGDAMVNRSFCPGARSALHLKDLRIALDLARDLFLATPISSLVEQLFLSLVASGGSDLDHTAVLRVIEGLSTERVAPWAENDVANGVVPRI